MRRKWGRAVLPLLYVVWAVYLLDVPDMPNPHAADIGFLGWWAFRSLNLLGGAIVAVLLQVCWYTKAWFFSPTFQQLSTGEFVVMVMLILVSGVVQWLGMGLLLGRLRRVNDVSRDEEHIAI